MTHPSQPPHHPRPPRPPRPHCPGDATPSESIYFLVPFLLITVIILTIKYFKK